MEVYRWDEVEDVVRFRIPVYRCRKYVEFDEIAKELAKHGIDAYELLRKARVENQWIELPDGRVVYASVIHAPNTVQGVQTGVWHYSEFIGIGRKVKQEVEEKYDDLMRRLYITYRIHLDFDACYSFSTTHV